MRFGGMRQSHRRDYSERYGTARYDLQRADRPGRRSLLSGWRKRNGTGDPPPSIPGSESEGIRR
jgi:hypothetical protein